MTRRAPLASRAARWLRAALSFLLVGLAALAALASSAVSVRAAAPGDRSGEAQAMAEYEAGKDAFGQGHYAVAASHFERAFEFFDDANILWNLGLSLERAGELASAKARLDALLLRDDVAAGVRKRAGEAPDRVVARLAARAAAKTTEALLLVVEDERDAAEDAGNAELVLRLDKEVAALQADLEAHGRALPDRSPSHALEWSLVAGGGAALATGLVLWLVGDVKHGDLRDAEAGAVDGVVSDMTRRRALSLRSQGDSLKIGGIVTGVAGLAAVGTGTVLLLLDHGPTHQGRVEVTGGVSPYGGSVELQVHW
ncbi:MAG: hypothetical protein U1F43_37130 [Myxococcota bacterium]